MRSRYGGEARAGARRILARAVAAREAGLDSLFVGDHHSVATGYFQNSPMLGRILAEWPRTAGALYLLPLWHPVLVAEQVATLAALAEGPFVMQCAVGGGTGQFAAMGADLGERAVRFEAGFDVIRRLLAGEEVTATGPVEVRQARIAPLPPQPVTVWIGGHARPAVDRAARLGDAWLAGPDLSEDRAAELAELYRDRCAAHDREPGVVAIRRDVYVGATRADAERTVAPAVAAGYRGFDPAILVYGDAPEVASRLGAFAELGFTDVLIRHIVDDQDQVLASFDRLGEVRAILSELG